MRRYSLCMVVVLSVALVPWATAQGPKAVSDPAEWVPSDALAYVGITDVAAVWSDLKKTTSFAKAEDEELKEAAASGFDFTAVGLKFKKRLAEMLDTDADQLDNPFAGPLAFYFTAPSGAATEDAVAVLIATGSEGPLLRQYFDTAISKLKDAANEYEEQEAAGVTLHVFTSEEGDESTGDEMDFESFEDESGIEAAMDRLFSTRTLPPKLVAALADNHLIISESVEGARTALTPRDKSASLAATDDHRALLQELKPTGDVRLLINVPRLIEMAKAEAGEDEDFRSTMTVLGAGSLRSAVGHLRLGTKSYDYKGEMLFLMGSQRTGLAKLLSMENHPVEPPANVPDHSSFYASLNIDPSVLFDEVLRLITLVDPDAAQGIRAQAEAVPMPDGTMVNVPVEVLSHLSGPLTFAFGFTKPYGPGSLRFLAALSHSDRDALMRFFGHVPELTPREYQGAQVFDAPTGAGQLAISSNRVFLGTPPAVEATLTNDESAPLLNDPAFKRALRLVPKEAWLALYVDEHKLLEAMMELSRKGPELAGDPNLMGMMFTLAMFGLDFSEMPAKTLDYAGQMMITVATTNEGVQVTMVALKPGKE
ncbi:MAG: hypothetical protein PVJ57_04425 [Phycisphaerae bacterium]|jgi:hypothetical protein